MSIAEGHECARQAQGAVVAKGQLRGFDGSKLRQLRDSRKLTRVELADLINQAPVSVGRWENAEQSPDPRTAKRIADLFGVSIRDLVSIEDDQIGLAELRMFTGQVTADVARDLRVSRNTLAAVESGHRPPGALVDGLAAAYGVSATTITTTWQRVRERRMVALRAKVAKQDPDAQ